VSIGGSFSFDGSTTSIAALNTFAGSIECEHKHSFSGDFHGQGVNECSTGTTPCKFTGIFGESENGFDTKLVGIVYAIETRRTDLPFGSASRKAAASVRQPGLSPLPKRTTWLPAPASLKT
jgi:hypothetical protein